MKQTITTKLAAASLLLCLGSSAHAALINYADRTAFNAANPGLSFEGFENVTDIGQVLNGTNIASGVHLAPIAGADTYLAGAGQSANPSQAIGINYPASDGWRISFSTSVNALAFDVYQNFGGGGQSGATIFANVEVFGADGLLGSFSTGVPSGAAGFFGVFSGTQAITSVTVNHVQSFDVIDNVAFGRRQASEVPEPGLLALFGIGLAGVAASRKRKA